MRRDSVRPRRGPDICSRFDASSNHITHQHAASNSLVPKPRTKRKPTFVSTLAAKATVLVSSILITSPAMIAPVRAQEASYRGDSHPSPSVYQYAFGIDSDSHQWAQSAAVTPSPTRKLPSQSRSSLAPKLSDIDDQLPDIHQPSSSLHRRQYDDESALFGERDPSSTPLHPIQLENEARPISVDPSITASAHHYSLPSTYPSSIASSWSRPERSVWFQQKAIIITSIFLAIFIVLFIGAAVFLRERKFDNELAGLDDEEALERIEERMNMGRFGGDSAEKESGASDGKKKKRFRFDKKRTEKDRDSPEPSTGSSSAIRRKRHLVSRWTRSNDRSSNDTVRSSDNASIRSGRSARRIALGDPSAPETVEITYDTEGAETQRINGESGETALLGSAPGSSTVNDDGNSSAGRPRSPPPPHPDSRDRYSSASSSDPRSSSNLDGQGSSNADASIRPSRRVLLDDSDFQAADAAETQNDELRHMPPAYIPSSSGSAGLPSAVYSGSALTSALARGDAKHGIPPPEERDPTVEPEVIGAVLASESSNQTDGYEPRGPIAAHIATDDKAVLGALSAAASMPSAPAAEASAPAYGAAEEPAAGASSSSAAASAPSGPSAPALQVDGEGFEIAPSDAIAASSTAAAPYADEKQASSAGKGKAKQTSSLLPAPPTPVETAFSPFDQPYRSPHPPGSTLPSTPPAGTAASPRKSEKQREAEQEQLASLVASRPEADVPVYERVQVGASAPPLAEAEEDEELPVGRLNLPAYEQRRQSLALREVIRAGAAAPAASAPPSEVEDEREQNGTRPTGPSAPSAPSAPEMEE